jgi:hypothetical protein
VAPLFPIQNDERGATEGRPYNNARLALTYFVR